MIDPKAKPGPYIKLLALVAVLGLISALVTFVFVALVHQGTALVWEQAALALGIDLCLFTVLVCTVGACCGDGVSRAIWHAIDLPFSAPAAVSR